MSECVSVAVISENSPKTERKIKRIQVAISSTSTRIINHCIQVTNITFRYIDRTQELNCFALYNTMSIVWCFSSFFDPFEWKRSIIFSIIQYAHFENEDTTRNCLGHGNSNIFRTCKHTYKMLVSPPQNIKLVQLFANMIDYQEHQ